MKRLPSSDNHSAPNPQSATAWNNLGTVLNSQGKLAEAMDAFSRTIQLQPNLPEGHCNLGNALTQLGQLPRAIAAFSRAITLRPGYADAYNNLGVALRMAGQFPQSVAAHQQAISLKPDDADGYSNLAITLTDQGRLAEALAACLRAIELSPNHAEAYNNLGNVRKDQGLLDEALAAFARAVALRPTDAAAHSNLVYTLHFHERYDAEAIFTAHQRWNRQHAEPLKPSIAPHSNARDPEKKLNIGYISPDFCRHPVGRFLAPLLKWHDRCQFSVFCYSDVRAEDSVSARLRGNADLWRNIAGQSDATVAEQIRRDEIDILVDLSMHMASNRLLVFARKPAPVQVTYLAYCSTTGLETIDYRLTDPYLEPPGLGDRYYSERSICLPKSYWCYEQGFATPDVNELPALSAGYVTFGCLNNFAKVSDGALTTWCALLRRMPGARLILHVREGDHRQRRDRHFGA